jgi:two-component sensor histidine kinase
VDPLGVTAEGSVPGRMTLGLGDRPEAVQQARHAVDSRLAEWQVAPDVADDVVLLTSELVTNALRHGSSPRTLVLHLQPDLVRLEVADGSPAHPHPLPAGPGQEGGRGVHLVDWVSAAWGSESLPERSPGLPGGKRVWCELPTRRAVGDWAS